MSTGLNNPIKIEPFQDYTETKVRQKQKKSFSRFYFSEGDCLDPSVYPAPTGPAFAMDNYYKEFAVPLGFDLGVVGAGTTLEEAEAARDATCTRTPDPSCETCSETDCFKVKRWLCC